MHTVCMCLFNTFLQFGPVKGLEHIGHTTASSDKDGDERRRVENEGEVDVVVVVIVVVVVVDTDEGDDFRMARALDDGDEDLGGV
jgi:hypothetical protein